MGRNMSMGLGLLAGLSAACVATGARAFCRLRMGASWRCLLVRTGVAWQVGLTEGVSTVADMQIGSAWGNDDPTSRQRRTAGLEPCDTCLTV